MNGEIVAVRDSAMVLEEVGFGSFGRIFVIFVDNGKSVECARNGKLTTAPKMAAKDLIPM